MLNLIDNLLNRITMYRLVLYYLIVLVVIAVVLCFFGILPFEPLDLILSILILVAVSWATNKIFSVTFKVPANVESSFITALILALIITPHGTLFLIWAAVLSQAAKYILAWKGKHLFNPAAFAVALTAVTLGQSASWWVGTPWMLAVVAIGGLLIVRKIQRFDLFLSFLAMALVVIIATSPSRSESFVLLEKILVHTPILFFAFIMLTEPMTTPATRAWRMTYGALTGLLFAPGIHIGSIYSTPELALLAGNIFSYVVSPKGKYLMTLKSKALLGTNTYNFIFEPNHKLNFKPGQYLEWTVGHKNPDTRGNRRYFTIASSPTEKEVHLGVKFYPNASSFKRHMVQLEPGQQILAGSLSGEFTIPADPKQKLVFIAGGIGITPFRSIMKYLLDKSEKRDIVLFYSNKSEAEVAFKNILEQAKQELGVKIIYNIGRLSPELIRQEVADAKDRMFYISGSHGFVVSQEKALTELGVSRTRIKTDFFPGFV